MDQAYHSDCKGPIIWPPKTIRAAHEKFRQAARDPNHPWHDIFGKG